MIVSGTIRYNHNHIDFEVKLPQGEISEEASLDPESTQTIIDAVNRKYRVKYPSLSTLDSLEIKG
ncbi:hypothetical protein MUO14_11220 [Halobacillus shinanisalinarum]|uniref:Uncharacterized protein n=1 Tax=Halobacillus shinanisalinarum TaxID=2932258 RepID=A0ABY4H4P8_9BACI|nr:hypothetical protein [Halobacillus shinanisalinarum]UOQ95441.1 hypothetical protein MUO14_11220 [Halobacillus shinanisalinarum]